MADSVSSSFFFFNDTATTEIYTLSLHDALPISLPPLRGGGGLRGGRAQGRPRDHHRAEGGRFRSRAPRRHRRLAGRSDPRDRKSTRLNSSHSQISYAVFCLKKKKKTHYSQSTIA